MKKLINGSQVELNKEFFSDYLYGKELQKITLSNIYIDLEVDSGLKKIIKMYSDVYDSLHPIMKTVESDLKYCLIGELMGVEYKVENRTLIIKKKNKDYFIFFRGEHWSIDDDAPKGGVIFKDCKNNKSFTIYENYLKTNGKNWVANCFPTLWEACDESEAKLERELDTGILDFIEIKPLEIDDDEILDLDLGIRYNVIVAYTGTSEQNQKQLVLNLDNAETKLGKSNKENYKYAVYKQELIEGKSGRKDYGKEVKEEGLFSDIFFILNQHQETKVRGVKVGDVIYYEVGNDIWKSYKGKSEVAIQKGKIYGTKLNNLLISWEKPLEQGIKKQVIYLLKDGSLDEASIRFIKEN